VVALQLAAAAESGWLTLAGYEEAHGNFGLSRIIRSPQMPEGAFTVPALALDDTLGKAGLANVDLLKMDIEGAEGFAMSGLHKSLADRRVQRIILELHPTRLAEHGHSSAKLICSLRTYGYHLSQIDHSYSVSRAAAYNSRLNPRELLRPI